MPNISTRLANCYSLIHFVYDTGKSSIPSLIAAALEVYMYPWTANGLAYRIEIFQ